MARQELVGQKRSMHLSAFRFDELSRNLRRIADEEGAEARHAGDRERGTADYTQ